MAHLPLHSLTSNGRVAGAGLSAAPGEGSAAAPVSPPPAPAPRHTKTSRIARRPSRAQGARQGGESGGRERRGASHTAFSHQTHLFNCPAFSPFFGLNPVFCPQKRLQNASKCIKTACFRVFLSPLQGATPTGSRRECGAVIPVNMRKLRFDRIALGRLHCPHLQITAPAPPSAPQAPRFRWCQSSGTLFAPMD